MEKINYGLACDFSDLDIKQLCEIDKAEFPWPWTTEQWMTLAHTNDHYLIFIKEENQILGFALFGLNFEEHLAHLYKIISLSAYRKKGIAQKLLLNSQRELLKIGYDRIYLEVSIKNDAAVSFYKKNQFETLVEKKSFYRDGTNAFAMQKTIRENLSN